MRLPKVKNIAVFIGLTLVLVAFIAFVEKQSMDKIYLDREVYIQGQSGLYFVEEKEIQNLISEAFPDLISGLPLEEVPLDDIEDRVLAHPFVKGAQAYIGQKGVLQLHVKQHRPLARIVRSGSEDAYITEEGKVIPTSDSYTSRVIVIHGRFAEQLMDEGEVLSKMPELMELIEFIGEDEFWSAQLTEIELQSKEDIRLYQQVGKQVVELGPAFDLEEKFRKIEVFYKEILPRKGWNAYNRVSVKFKNQIVCE